MVVTLKSSSAVHALEYCTVYLGEFGYVSRFMLLSSGLWHRITWQNLPWSCRRYVPPKRWHTVMFLRNAGTRLCSSETLAHGVKPEHCNTTLQSCEKLKFCRPVELELFYWHSLATNVRLIGVSVMADGEKLGKCQSVLLVESIFIYSPALRGHTFFSCLHKFERHIWGIFRN